MSDTIVSPLTSAERTDARRYCGYPAYGSGQSGFESWRFFSVYGVLEYRLSNLSPDELTVMRTYLGQLSALEVALLGSGDDLDTDQAAIWRRNRTEFRDRTALYVSWCSRLCGFLGIPTGPALSSSNSIRV